METIIAVICAIVVVISIPLIFIKPHWVFYLFIISALFGNILNSYIYQAGNLGAPRAWAPADFLMLGTIIASAMIEKKPTKNFIKKCFTVIIIVSFVSLLMGIIRNFHSATTRYRQIYFLGSMVFASRYFTNTKRVNNFLRFSLLLLLVIFVFHMLIRFGIYKPPFETQKRVGAVIGERGEISFGLVVYVALTGIALGRLATSIRPFVFSAVFLMAGFIGVFFSETRLLFGCVAMQGLASMALFRGKIRTLILFIAIIFLGVSVTQAVGFDPFKRFKVSLQRYGGAVRLDQVRIREYSTIVQSYKEEPAFIVLGRGIGALHYLPFVETGSALYQSFYHSAYLDLLDKFGLVGLFAVLSLFINSTWISFQLSRSDVIQLKFYGTVCFLVIITLMAHSIFSPNLTLGRAGPLLICFIAIVANWEAIYNSICLKNDYPQEISEQDVCSDSTIMSY